MADKIPAEVGRNLSPAEAENALEGGPPCTKPDTTPCVGGETKCINGDLYKCGSKGWFNSNQKC